MTKLLNNWILDGEIFISPSGQKFTGGDSMTAGQIEQCCGIPSGVTLIHNHAGTVPASHVLREMDDGYGWFARHIRGHNE